MESTLKRTWAEIDLDHLTHNFKVIRRHVGDKVKLLGVVKADGYGHGAVEIAKRLEQLGAGYLAVSNIDECEELRDSGVTLPILMLGFTPADQTARILQLHMTQAVQSYDIAKEFSDRAIALGEKMTVHVKLDTGMGRLGFSCDEAHFDASLRDILRVLELPGLDIEGVFTHFCVSDEAADECVEFTKIQHDRFLRMIDAVETQGNFRFRLHHCCNAGGIASYPGWAWDMVRCGIILYGTGTEKLTIYYERANGRGTLERPFEGVVNNVSRRLTETQSDAMRKELEECMSERPCPKCHGKRLSDISLAVTVGGMNIMDFCAMPISEELKFVDNLKLTGSMAVIAEQIVREIRSRLSFLQAVGLSYLTLSRSAATLSGGESQRIRLATQIGSSLIGVLYILDEPSIGLHQRDNDKLLDTLRRLRDIGNSVLVVEHDEDTMRAADFIVDVGPGAGSHGGEIVAAGTLEDIINCPRSVTGQYLSGVKKIPVPTTRRAGNGNFLRIRGARENNLKNVDVSIPLGTFVCVTGVSGSGKSSLVNEILNKTLLATLNHARTRPGLCDGIDGMEYLDKVIDIDQSPIGRTPRSNPATYTGLFNDIRDLFASTNEAKIRGYGPGRFSFNVKGGRCEACCGDGLVKIEMHFLADVYVPCEVCHGARYNRETLEVHYKGKNIAQVLDMTAEEAVDFFENLPKIRRKAQTLMEVGLGYVKLGQSSTTLSGGEAQRVKLATELARVSTGKTIYILDEPTTGLHAADVHKLIEVLQRLVEAGNTVLVIEHNLDVIKTADYLIDLGPEGGDGGGTLVASGTPEEVAQIPESYTGQYLKSYL